MAETATSASDNAALTGTAAAPWPIGVIVRDISRGGLAGLIVGVLVGGVGGRLIMRLAALLVPSANGALTENGNRIGEITIAGSMALIVFVGLFAGLALAILWVVIRPWLPGTALVRGVSAIPIVVAFGAMGLIDRTNPDFVVLEHDPIVVASLVALVALTAPAMVLADGWLDRRLPRATTGESPATTAYLVLTIIGVGLGLPLTVQLATTSRTQPLGVMLILVGFATLAWWAQRLRGRTEPSQALRLAARALLVVGTALGFAVLAPEVAGALDLG
jgi:hypothetical protein